MVLATPGPPAARLLADVAPEAAAELAAVEYASMAIVTLAVPALEVGDSSGFLVPAVDGRRIKAATYSFSKWGWVGAASDLRILRASIGRHREEASFRPRTTSWWRGWSPTCAGDGSGDPARSRHTCSAGVARCRSTPSATSTGWRASGPRSRRVPGLARVRRGVRRGRDPGRDRVGPPGGGFAARGRMRAWPSHRDEQTRRPRRTRELNDTSATRCGRCSGSTRRSGRADGGADRGAEAAEVEELFEKLAADDVVVRGTYDVSGLRADADVMVWWHAATSEQLQTAYNRLRRTAFGRRLAPVWSQMALHRPAEFNKSHVPAFLAEEEARAHVCVYPFVRSYEWYLLEETERRAAARRARPDGARLPRRPRQHRRQLRARRLRVDPGVRGRRPGAASST